MKKQILKVNPVDQKAKMDPTPLTRPDPNNPDRPESNQDSPQKSSPGARNFPSQNTEKPW
jgi:hypothetical protein